MSLSREAGPMDERDQIVEWVADTECKRIAAKVRRELQRMTEGMQSGDDSPLANLWDEVCVQMQQELSYVWEDYEDIMEGLIGKHTAALNPRAGCAIWLQTEQGSEWAGERQDEATSAVEAAARLDALAHAEFLVAEKAQPGVDHGPLLDPLIEAQDEARMELDDQKTQAARMEEDGMPYLDDDVVAHILHRYLLPMASDWKNRQIERYIDLRMELD